MCIVTWMIALVTDVPLILDEGHVFDQKLLICNSDRTNFGYAPPNLVCKVSVTIFG